MNKCQCHCNCQTDTWEEVAAASRAALPEHVVQFIEECRREPNPSSQLISVLHKVQGHFGYLGQKQMDAVAQLMQIPASKVTGVATFYHFFRLKPGGRYIVNVCLGTACYVKGGAEIAEKLKEELGVDFGETSKDGMFTLEAARCLGTCGLSPVIMVNSTVHAKVKPDEIPAILARYREKAQTAAAG